jgi:hypothetical protein
MERTLLLPGASHPYAPMEVAALAHFLHVPEAEIRRWLAEGLPITRDGLVDPFACSNWLCWGRLDRCPALARRWRTYLTFFAPFVAGEDRPRRVAWRRVHRLYLPKRAQEVIWSLAAPTTTAGQVVERMVPPASAGLSVATPPGWWHFMGAPTDSVPLAKGEATLRLLPRVELPAAAGEHAALAALVEEVAGTFRYEYRHHHPGEYADEIAGRREPRPRWYGSCLDCALALAALLSDRQRRWRLVGGVVADSRIANPHFWLECEIAGGGWAPLDPSLPAIVRMVGGDWRTATRAWTGALDARRVTLGVVGPGLPGIPGGPTVGSLMGEAVVDGRNAWPCLDWVCGDCESEFTEV